MKPSAAVELMRAESDGRATFLVHPEASAASPLAPDLSSHPGIVGRLRDMLRLTNGFAQAPAGLAAAGSRAASWCPIRGAAQAWPNLHPDCYFLLPDGVSYHGHAVSGGRKSAGGPLASEARTARIDRARGNAQREADELTAELETLERGIALLAEDLEQLRAIATGARKRRAGSGPRAAQAGGGICPRRIAALGGAPGLGTAGSRRRAVARATRAESGAGCRKRTGSVRSGKSCSKSPAANSNGCKPMLTVSARNMPRYEPA